jgi:GTPase SAR1 family protein
MSDTNDGVTKHIAIVGDGEVGKTCLLHAFTDETFFLDYIPTMYVYFCYIGWD